MTLISDAYIGLWFATNWSGTSHSGVKNSFKTIEHIAILLLQNHVSQYVEGSLGACFSGSS